MPRVMEFPKRLNTDSKFPENSRGQVVKKVMQKLKQTKSNKNQKLEDFSFYSVLTVDVNFCLMRWQYFLCCTKETSHSKN